MLTLWHANAIRDLIRIRAYIAKENPAAANRVVARLRSVAAMLRENPRMGRAGRVAETREFVFGNLPYIAVYRIDEAAATLEILNIIHTAQLYPDND
ncbi:MAG: type II toxin-antitoxin system RelE/ParE family toxin [Alphaproteobacteria bacterium]|nr:type II toxin-antitoxin system RelE/ParE family toxin [Alphaproteobacteria bacterium]MBV9692770.1 type II toxin-antitoxin system RelE/ParE family toxin [Alphaproteobacteria bacterium]